MYYFDIQVKVKMTVTLLTRASVDASQCCIALQVSVFFYWLIINKENFFLMAQAFETESFSSSGEILLKNTDLHARSLYPIYSLFYFIVFFFIIGLKNVCI